MSFKKCLQHLKGHINHSVSIGTQITIDDCDSSLPWLLLPFFTQRITNGKFARIQGQNMFLGGAFRSLLIDMQGTVYCESMWCSQSRYWKSFVIYPFKMKTVVIKNWENDFTVNTYYLYSLNQWFSNFFFKHHPLAILRHSQGWCLGNVSQYLSWKEGT